MGESEFNDQNVVHRVVQVGETRLHVAEQGEGPPVILVHGFPESWYSWRHQLPALAQAGYRAVAIDVRGYGRSSRPEPIEAYRMLALVADVVGLASILSEQPAFLVGHDWGAPIVWNSALLRPDRFHGVVGLSVPYAARGGTRPSTAFRAMGGDDHEFYIEYFQEPGRAEAEIEQDVRGWLEGFYYSASGEVAPQEQAIGLVPHGGTLRGQMTRPKALPAWLTQADLDFYCGEFERTGFTGGLNRYRNVDRDWEDLAAFAHRPIEIPAMFVGGSRDGPTLWGASAIEAFERTLPRLVRAEILSGCGHWVQQERAADTNRLLVEFLDGLRE